MKKLFLGYCIVLSVGLFITAGANNSVTADLSNYQLNINGEAVDLSSSIVVIDGKTYAPVRELAENMGAEVYWNGEEGKVSIFTDVKESTKHKGTQGDGSLVSTEIN